MDIPANSYKLFLDEVKKLYKKELDKLGREPKTGKLSYWEEKNTRKVSILYDIDIGTVETRHFYYTEKQLRDNPKKDVEESNKVVIAVLNKIGIVCPNDTKDAISHLPEKLRIEEEAKYLFKIFQQNNSNVTNGVNTPVVGKSENSFFAPTDNLLFYEVNIDLGKWPPRTYIKSDFFKSIDEELEFNKDLVTRHIKKYYEALSDKNYHLAQKFWHIEKNSDIWIGNTVEFAKQFYYTLDIENANTTVTIPEVHSEKRLAEFVIIPERDDAYESHEFPENNLLTSICHVTFNEVLHSFYNSILEEIAKLKVKDIDAITTAFKKLSDIIKASGIDRLAELTIGQILDGELSHTLIQNGLLDIGKLEKVFENSYEFHNFRTETVYLKNVSYHDGGYQWCITHIEKTSRSICSY